MAWITLVVANVVTVLIATIVALLLVVAVQFGLNDGQLGKAPIPLSWSVVSQGFAIPLMVIVIVFLPAVILLKQDLPAWAFGVTSFPYIFLLVTLPVWWPPLVLFLGRRFAA